MAFTGYLTDFSLPEIFQFMEQGQKTGLLTIRTLPAAQTQEEVPCYYIWLHQGRIVAAADRVDEKGLVSAITQRAWVSERVAEKMFQTCPINTPIGLCLKSYGLLQAEQLTLLFRTQVLGLVSNLFQLNNGQFEFLPRASVPPIEMTGLSLPATEATLMGLRTLRDWTVLAEKLPDMTSAIISKINGKPQLRLDSTESQVWELTNGSISLRAIAKQLEISGEKVQQIAFRLIVSNLAEEVFILDTPAAAVENSYLEENRLQPFEESANKNYANQPVVAASTRGGKNLSEPVANASSKSNISQSFLQNLVGFLRAKT